MIKYDINDNNKEISLNKKSKVMQKIIIGGLLITVVLFSGATKVYAQSNSNVITTDNITQEYNGLPDRYDGNQLETRGFLAEKIAEDIVETKKQEMNQEPTVKFTDVDYNNEYSKAINIVSNNGIMVGRENGTFGAGDNITMEEVIVALCRKNGIEPIANSANSLNASEWAKGYVDAALELGLIDNISFNSIKETVSRDLTRAINENFLNYSLPVNSTQINSR